ncbi:MAG: hypothetical protein AAF694_20860 [Bacteroidota bacterium]
MKAINLSILFLIIGCLSLQGQGDQTLFDGKKLKMSGSWTGISFTQTQVSNEDITQIGLSTEFEFERSFLLGWQWRSAIDDGIDLNYHVFTLGYALNTASLIHPRLTIGLGPGNIQLSGDKDQILVFQPALGVEVNLLKWARLSIEGGYRNVSGDEIDPLVERGDLSGFFGTATLRFGWSWGMDN